MQMYYMRPFLERLTIFGLCCMMMKLDFTIYCVKKEGWTQNIVYIAFV